MKGIVINIVNKFLTKLTNNLKNNNNQLKYKILITKYLNFKKSLRHYNTRILNFNK